MVHKNRIKTLYLDFLAFFIIFDMVLGGAGRVISLGPISLRMVLLALGLVTSLPYILKSKKFDVLFWVVIAYFACSLIYGIILNGQSNSIGEFKGYLSLLSCLYFVYYVKVRKIKIPKLLKFLKITLRILVFLQIGIWVYAYISGPSVYLTLHDIFEKYEYGIFSYVDSNNTIPRVFLKTSIFVFVLLICDYSDFRHSKNIKLKNILFILLDVLAFFTNFTLGFWLAGAICLVVYIFIDEVKLKYDKYILYFTVLLLATVFAVRFNLFEVVMTRFSYGGSVEHKSVQLETLLHYIKFKPIFGYGFGYEISYVTGDVTNYRYVFEISWLQIWLHNGLIGLILYSTLILRTVYRLYKLFKLYKNTKFGRICVILSISIIYMCISSFFNPFMNNSIGLTLFALCYGISIGYKIPVKARNKIMVKQMIVKEA